MIRPVVGDPLKTTSIDDTQAGERKSSFKIWPNPASDVINLEAEDLALSPKAYISIIDLQGRQVMKIPYSERIDISSLRAGFYTVIASVNGRPAGYLKLIKNR
jgi:hypothetical protein